MLTDILCILGGVGKSCLTGKAHLNAFYHATQIYVQYLTETFIAQFVQNVWIESYDPTIEDSYRKQIEVDVSIDPNSCLSNADP